MENAKFISLEKQSPKARKRHYAARRNDWNGIVPVTRVIPNKKKAGPRQQKHRQTGEAE